MNEFLKEMETQFTELASRITNLESVDDQPEKLAKLDQELVAQTAAIRRQYDACKEIEKLQNEGQVLDSQISSILIELDDCRKKLEKTPPASRDLAATQKVDAQTLLDYATKITRFTQQIPGTVDPSILPWPTEDWLRRGMLATLTIQDEQRQSMPADENQEPEPEMEVDETLSTAVTVPPSANREAGPAAGGEPSTRPAPAPRKPKQKISLDFDSDED